MSSPFRHSICDLCWARERGTREPVRIVPRYREDEVCCWCGATHRSGIYTREDPAKVPCGGRGGTHDSAE
jgi:hypothetical protein